MHTKTLVIHHTAFFRADLDGDRYAKHTLVCTVEGSAPPTAEDFAETAFRDTNHPSFLPKTVKKEGRCYSLSCGDFVEVPGDLEGDAPSFWLCRGTGWKEVSKEHMDRAIEHMIAFHKANPNQHWTMECDGNRYIALLVVRGSAPAV